MNVKKMYALTMEHVKIKMAATYVIVRKIFKERIAWKLSMSALRLHAKTMGSVLMLKKVMPVSVNLALMAKNASQGLANLIHVTTMVHVSLTDYLHFAHAWRDSLGKIVHKTWMSVCMIHVMTTSLAKTPSVAMNVCPVPRLTIVLTNRKKHCVVNIRAKTKASVLERIPRIRVCVKPDGQGIVVK